MAEQGKPLPIPLRQQIREYREKRISERRTALLLGLHRDTVRKN
jgi:DNA-binding protein Fis